MINHNNNFDDRQHPGGIIRFPNNQPGGLGLSSGRMTQYPCTPPYGQGRNSGFFQPQFVNGLHPDWQTYTFVDVFVHNLPPHVTTLDLYKNFSGYGAISKIEISDSRDGGRKNQADIRFK